MLYGILFTPPQKPMVHRITTLAESCVTLLLFTLAFMTLPLKAQDGTITIDVASPSHSIPATLYGVFFEEINHGGEGGLYGELIKNRSFSASSLPENWSMEAEGTAYWRSTTGSWNVDTSVSPGAYTQNINGEDVRSIFTGQGSENWSNYMISLQARKLGGDEAFFIMFNVQDFDNWIRWNIGGWGNTQHALQECVNGTQTTGPHVSGSINTDQWYDIRVEIMDGTIHCYLDDVLIQSYTSAENFSGSIGLATWNTQAQFRNIVVTDSSSQVLYESDFDAGSSLEGAISVDYTKPLTAKNTDSLKLSLTSDSGNLGVSNNGFWGIPLQAGASYHLSLYAACETGFSGSINVALKSIDGSIVYAQTTLSGLTTDWQMYNDVLTASGSDTNAKLVLSIDQPGTVWLDVVSLFPEETYMNRENGMRQDLATAVADMNPGFLRFPGGCYVEGNYNLGNFYQWKDSIGTPAERVGLDTYWGYSASNGLGYHEYLQYAEDIGAEPLFCAYAGMSHNGVVPMDQMDACVQDALDAIEYANGDTSTTWGSKRAANGHPEPFNMKYIQIGNENGGTEYNERYALLYDAIKAAYPDMNIVACVWGGTPNSRPFDLMDEHHYTNVSTMYSYATKYDNYDRNGPKVFVGEYAVTSGMGTYGNLAAALGEAAFMTGIERNCDVVSMASYAPLFCNLPMRTSSWTWMPDAIYFDNSNWFGTPAYHVQKMFANNTGSVLLPMTQNFGMAYGGSIGLSTWNTDAEFRNIVVTGSTSEVLYQSDFTTGPTDWVTSGGTWTATDSYRQTDTGVQDGQTVYAGIGSQDWKDYTLTLEARKQSGDEGFLIMFYVADSDNWYWWNVGGWGNTQHAIEYAIDGVKHSGPKVSGSILNNQWYDIRIEVNGNTVKCYLDDILTQSFTLPSQAPTYSVASLDESTREIIVKTVNPLDSTLTTDMVLDGVDSIAPTTEQLFLTSTSLDDENTLETPLRVAPETRIVSSPSTHFEVTLPAHSLSIFRIQGLAVAPNFMTATAANQRVILEWERAAGASTYKVLRSTDREGPYIAIATDITDLSYTDSSLENHTTYYYSLVSVNSAGETTSPTQVTATPVPPELTHGENPQAPEMAGENVIITIPKSVIGRQYQLQFTDDLSTGNWNNLGNPIDGTGDTLQFTDNTYQGEPARFYLIEIQ